MREEGSPPDKTVANLAARQHGVVSTAQLAGAGIRRSGLSRRVRSGRLHRIHRGVYAVGHPALSQEGTWLAAVLASGEGALLSHRSAAGLWGLIPASGGAVDVTISHTARRGPRRGIHIHRSRTLSAESTARKRGISVTTPARTVVDLRSVVSPNQLRRAIREAEALGLALAEELEPVHTRSELEHSFLRLCRRHRLPMPEVNVSIDRFVVDFLWRRQAMIVETDGYRYHRGRQAFEDDRARDAALRLSGFEVVRFSYRQVFDEPTRVVELLQTLLVSKHKAAAGEHSSRRW